MRVIYVLGTLIVAIVMLNLLIAVISTHYEEVVEMQDEANCAERMKIVNDIAYMLPEGTKKKSSKENELILRASVAKTKA